MKLKKFLMLLIVGIILIISISMTTEKPREYNDIIIKNDYSIMDRLSYNDLVKYDIDKAIIFYNQITKDKKISKFIIHYALLYNVPINLSFSLALNESSMKKDAINYNEFSSDYGLYQLNSYTYKKYNSSYLLDLVNNIRLGNEHLYKNYKLTGNWEEAIINYNCGFQDRVPRRSIDYLIKILKTEKRLNKEFLNFINKMY